MYRFTVALVIALSGYASAPAMAGGFGCCGAGLPMGSGCLGGWYSSGWVPVGGYGCWGTPMSYGCTGGWYSSGWVPVGGYGCGGGWYGGCSGMSVAYGGFGGWSGWSGSAWVPAEGDWYSSALPATPGSYRPYEEEMPYASSRPVNPRPDRAPEGSHAAPRQEPRTESPPASPTSSEEQIGAPEEAKAPARATIVVRLPVGAKLTINNAATHSTEAIRRFVTPPLKPDKDFHYTLKAELVRDGRAVTTTRRVAVRGGEEKQVQLEFPTANVSRQ